MSVQEHMKYWYMHVSKALLTTMETQALIVVNSVKLHRTAFNEFDTGGDF